MKGGGTHRKKSRRKEDSLGGPGMSHRVEISPHLSLSLSSPSCDGSSCLPSRSHQATDPEIPKGQSQHFQELLQNSPGHPWMRARFA